LAVCRVFPVKCPEFPVKCPEESRKPPGGRALRLYIASNGRV
jgi:hypothetical protein